MFKLKDVFKVAVVGAAGYFGGQIGAQFGKQTIGKKIGTALGQSLMSRGSGSEPASAQFTRSSINLSQFGMPTYAAGRARSDMIPGSMRVVPGRLPLFPASQRINPSTSPKLASFTD